MKNIIMKISRKFAYSFVGIWITLKEEKSIWAYLAISGILIGVGVWTKLSYTEWAIVALTIFVVISIEVSNTSIEASVDALSFQYNIKVKKIKDIAAGATLVITTGAIVVLLLIYIPAIKGVL